VAITASPDSPLARAAGAVVVQHVASQRAVTHTQAVAGAYACGLALWAALTGDAALEDVVRAAPGAAAEAVPAAEAWADEVLAELAAQTGGADTSWPGGADEARPGGADEAPPGGAGSARPLPPAAAIAMGGGPRWAAALELALMLKEISRVPAEGVETREGATSAMFGLARGHLALSLDPDGDPAGDEARRLCAATGATVVGLPVAPGEDARLAPITSLPAAAALSAGLALAAGHAVDEPAWTAAYYATAR
jgi:fructoselysine-6-P-deglycase FrlB-like protein